MTHLLTLNKCLAQNNVQIKLISLVSNKWRLNSNTFSCVIPYDILIYAGLEGYENICYWVKNFPENLEIWTLDRFLASAVKGGHVNLCHLAKEWGATDFNLMLRAAALRGHENLCWLAKEWGATNFESMLVNGAAGGHEHICWLARSWGATRFYDMLNMAIYSKHANIQELSEIWTHYSDEKYTFQD